MNFWLEKPKNSSKIAKFRFFGCKLVKFYVKCLKFCTETPFSIVNKNKKRVDQVPEYFARKRQKFKKWKIKILQKSLYKANFWKKLQNFPHTAGNKSPYAYLLACKILWHCPYYKTQKKPLKVWKNGSQNSAFLAIWIHFISLWPNALYHWHKILHISSQVLRESPCQISASKSNFNYEFSIIFSPK